MRHNDAVKRVIGVGEDATVLIEFTTTQLHKAEAQRRQRIAATLIDVCSLLVFQCAQYAGIPYDAERIAKAVDCNSIRERLTCELGRHQQNKCEQDSPIDRAAPEYATVHSHFYTSRPHEPALATVR